MSATQIVAALSIAAALPVAIIDAAPTQWKTRDGGTGNWYEVVPVTMTWHEAKVDAEARTHMGVAGHLATFSNQAENDFVVYEVMATYWSHTGGVPGDGIWAGMTDEVVEGEWRWIDDTPGVWQHSAEFPMPEQTAYTNWESLNGFEGVTSNYLSVRIWNNWNDYYNDHMLDGYLIEFETYIVPDQNSDGYVDIFDVAVVSAAWGNSGLPGIQGDANKDGAVDIFDVALISNHWNRSTPTTAVPEPGALALSGLAIVGMCLHRRLCTLPRPGASGYPLKS